MRIVFVAGLLLGVLVAGTACAREPAEPPVAGRSASTAGSAPAPRGAAGPSGSADLSRTPPPTLGRPSGAPKTPSDSFEEITTDGLVRRSAGCVDLVTATLTWTLLGDTAPLRDGQRIRVSGLPEPGVETACTGSPLRLRAWS